MENTAANNTDEASIIKDNAFWQKHVSLFESSRLTRAQYCRTYQLSYQRFGHWVRQFKRNKLVPVKLSPRMTSDRRESLCTLIFNNGCRLNIHDLQAVSFILKQLA